MITDVLKPLKYSLEDSDFAHAIALLKRGQLLAFPTETVYGLGAPIFNVSVIERIFVVKGRPQDNPLIAHIHCLDQVLLIAKEIPPEFYLLAESFFPGPLTIVLKKKEIVPSIVTAGGEAIAFRMPAHPLALSLISHMQEPLVAPSANLSGRPSATCVAHVLEDFSGKIAAVVEGGACQFGLESTVLSLLDPKNPIILRPGAITQYQIEECVGRRVGIIKKTEAHEKVASPGMKYRHYAPHAKIFLFSSWDALETHIRKNPHCKRKLLSHSKEGTLPLLPQNLYSHFRQADKEECREVLILCDESVTSDQALYNRILKAAE